MKKRFLLAIDQGTTSTRAILFDLKGRPRARHSVPLRQIYPANGWVEHDPMEIWRGVQACLKAVLKDVPNGAVAAPGILGLGITNQRETSVIWDANTGKPLHNAIVWQDRRGAARCTELKASGWEAKIARKTGLLLDPYFSATKLEWLLAHVKGAKAKAAKGAIRFGTIDSWLIWRLTGGRVHATDVTNASRTMLFNLKTRDWDDELLGLFGVPRAMLPQIKDSVADFGMAHGPFLGKGREPIPILGVAGDQQAASFGQACFSPGDVKATYGTGCFALVNTGKAIPRSRNRLLVTALAQQDYAVEGSIFIAGAVVQWLRDAMGIIATAPAVEALVKTARPYEGLYFVPAFTGLGAPYWDPQARGAILGLTRDMGKAEVAAAALDAVCYQTRDLMDAMAKDMAGATAKKNRKIRLRELKVDGGMVANDFFCQRLADLTGLAVARPRVTETTALGAALLAGQGVGLFRTRMDIAALWALDRRFTPRMRAPERDALYRGWRAAVARIRAS